MIIDMKTHVVSLIAVFLALGIGIFIGSILVGGDTLQEAQERMVARLEQDVDNLIKETKMASKQAKLMEENLDALTKLDELVISRVLAQYFGQQQLFLLALDGEFEEEVVSALGLPVESVVLFPDDSGLNCDRLTTAIRWLMREERVHWGPEVSLSSPEGADIDRTVLRLWEGLRKEKPILLILGAGLVSKCGANRDTLAEIRQLASEAGVTLAVVTTSDSAFPLENRNLREIGISSVDCIDLPAGRLALALIAGGDTGNFGLGTSWTDARRNAKVDEASDATDR